MCLKCKPDWKHFVADLFLPIYCRFHFVNILILVKFIVIYVFINNSEIYVAFVISEIF